jgi:hypothetical protein
MLHSLKEKPNRILPVLFLALFALSRWPGLFPPSFSMAYALVFCAGVYFTRGMAWWLPIGTLVLTDIALNFYWQSHGTEVWSWSTLRFQLVNYVGYGALIWFGRRFKPKSSFASLLGGGIFGAILFYFITNTASWLFNPFGNPEYSKTFWGWITALITGTNGWPETWQFFRNTLLSGGLFTALFVGAMKLSTAESAQEKKEPATPQEPEGDEAPEEAAA